MRRSKPMNLPSMAISTFLALSMDQPRPFLSRRSAPSHQKRRSRGMGHV